VVLAMRLDRAAGRALPAVPGLFAVGMALVVAGGFLAALCAVFFVVEGEGTPAPFDAPRRFVAVGPYRFVRNPMYVGATTLLVGLGLVLNAPSVFGVAFAAFFLSNLFVIFVEEPGLARRFGETYLAYRRATKRWIPRLARAA
jgi:protein-S-isoprenylcysteine O-methyltransferase Ste14